MATDPSPSRLAARLRGLPGVLDCATVSLGSSGPVAAFVVPAPGESAGQLKRRLAAAALEAGTTVLPVLVDEVPRAADGAVARRAWRTYRCWARSRCAGTGRSARRPVWTWTWPWNQRAHGTPGVPHAVNAACGWVAEAPGGRGGAA